MLCAGLDVANATTTICIVEPSGTIVREGKAASEPEAIAAFLGATGRPFTRVGLEAGALAEWIHAGLAELGLPVACLETRHLHATLSAQPVKTDRNDARGIAQVVRVGWFKPVHAKTAQAQKLRALVVARKGLVRELAGTEQLVRGLSRPFGLKVGPVVRRRFAGRGRELVEDKPVLAQVAEALLEARRVLVEQVQALQRLVLAAVRRDPVCRRLMSMPGIGPVVALTFRASIDQPHRFRRSRSVGAYFGPTPRRCQPGEVGRTGRISKAGDVAVRAALFEAANVILRPSTRWSSLKAWAARVAKRQGRKRAKVALARKIAGVLHRMWVDGTEFRWAAAGGLAGCGDHGQPRSAGRGLGQLGRSVAATSVGAPKRAR